MNSHVRTPTHTYKEPMVSDKNCMVVVTHVVVEKPLLKVYYMFHWLVGCQIWSSTSLKCGNIWNENTNTKGYSQYSLIMTKWLSPHCKSQLVNLK